MKTIPSAARHRINTTPAPPSIHRIHVGMVIVMVFSPHTGSGKNHRQSIRFLLRRVYCIVENEHSLNSVFLLVISLHQTLVPRYPFRAPGHNLALDRSRPVSLLLCPMQNKRFRYSIECFASIPFPRRTWCHFPDAVFSAVYLVRWL